MRLLRAGLATVVVVGLLVGAFFIVMKPVWRNDERLWHFEIRVTGYPRPEGARRAGYSSTVDNLSGGNGDYCQFQVHLKLKTDISPQRIRTWYEHAEIVGVSDKAQVSAHGEGGVVTVEFTDIHPSDWDWRCI